MSPHFSIFKDVSSPVQAMVITNGTCMNIFPPLKKLQYLVFTIIEYNYLKHRYQPVIVKDLQECPTSL